ncbi:L-lactate dehydrogenase [Sphingomonas gei]|uniref:L-lactate dehydrogenase n=1 Tax=Sphingomonas gei TaxID=1395960 RepID=A0A4S1X9B8_9SPHN|nr:L-lactate dehydrogenase [Sphingomonas gei]TGX52588.1 L-lactate dehydrogenase [Sphingomonas gei]
MTGPNPSGSRVAIVGTGHVGATAAYALMLRALFREIVLIDSNADLARAEAADLKDANALARPARIWAGTYADARTASIAVVTAGGATHGSQSRLSVAGESAKIVTSCVDELIGAGFAGIILVAANPVDLMSLVAFRRSGLPSSHVIGTGTLLDTNRLRQELAVKLGVSAWAVEGFVLGEHGDSEVVAFSSLRVGGLSMKAFASPSPEPDRSEIARKVREAAYEIASGKGYTSFGVATAIVRICEAIVRDEHAVLPVSTLLTGQLGIGDLYLSLPCVLGAGGIERVLIPDLSSAEAEALRRSAAALAEAGSSIGIDPGTPTS